MNLVIVTDADERVASFKLPRWIMKVTVNADSEKWCCERLPPV
jgi:hypothetical protein